MLPFYHPTTIVALDDDPVFLESFAFHYGEDFICQTFTRPEEAIRFCNERRDHSDVVRQLFRDDVDVGDAISVAPGDQVLRVESAGMRTLSSDPGRFEQLSLLCVDFSMPGLNGIDVCRQLRDHPIRKILLTGKAGDETAVKAFNEGLIDCFLMKQMADLPRILKREMESLQRSYFTELTRPVEVALSAHREDFGAHSGLRSYFLDIFDRRGICEYYRVLNPAGIAMIDDDGAPLFLSVCDEETMRAAEEIAAGEGAPEVLVRMLASRSIVPIFPQTGIAYGAHVAETWNDHVWPAQSVEGAANEPVLYLSLIDGPAARAMLPANMSSYADYRDARDPL